MMGRIIGNSSRAGMRVCVRVCVPACTYVSVFSTNLLLGVFIALVVVSYFSSEKF